MSDTPWTDNHERVGKIRSSGAVMGVVPSVYVRELETELAEARAEIAERDKLIEQMRAALKIAAPCVKEIFGYHSKDCVEIKAALSAAERPTNENPNK